MRRAEEIALGNQIRRRKDLRQEIQLLERYPSPENNRRKAKVEKMLENLELKLARKGV